jgi:hypothetical protein
VKSSAVQRINVVDIECIEPVTRSSNFILYYYEHVKEQTGGLFWVKKQKHNLRDDHYQSRHVGEIIYAYQQILEALEAEERELGLLHSSESSDSSPIKSPDEKPISSAQSKHVLASHSLQVLKSSYSNTP